MRIRFLVLSSKIKFGIFISLFIPVILLDQWSKKWALGSLKGQHPTDYLGGLLKFIYAENRGAWGSIGSNLGENWHFVILILLPSLALLAFAFYVFKTPKISLYEFISYSFILSGGFGNLIDRVLYGYVIDFLYIGYGSIGTNIFNIADVAIMTGVIMLILQYFQEKLAKKSVEKNA